jgi:peroxiredoxin
MPTLSYQLDIGKACPDFSLFSVDKNRYNLDSFSKSKGLLVAFICNHCPYVQAIEDRFLALTKVYAKKDIQTIAICSNDWQEFPDDAPECLYKRSIEKSFGFPYLIDETQEVAKAFNAACTPDLYLYDGKRKLFYHGRFDDNWKDQTQVKTQDLKEAIDDLLVDKNPPSRQYPAIGCSIKWKN